MKALEDTMLYTMVTDLVFLQVSSIVWELIEDADTAVGVLDDAFIRFLIPYITYIAAHQR